MATPHIAGAMALLWSAIPSLRHQITASRDALNNSAVHIDSTQCGDAGTSKQRLWLGPGRYRCCGRNAAYDRRRILRHQTATPYGRQRLQHQLPAPLQQHRQLHAATDANTQIGANGQAASHASAQAIEFRRRKFLVIGHR